MPADSFFPPVSYTLEEHETWQILLHRFTEMIPRYMCREYLDGFERMAFPTDRIPTLKEVQDRLRLYSDWSIRRVNGIVPDAEFYAAFADRSFPSNDYIRTRDDMDYTPHPDIFHEIVGHVPILTNPAMAAFTQKLGAFAGEILRQYGPAQLVPLARIYWFTLEFGLIDTPEGVKILGAGFAPGEMRHAFTDEVVRRPFVIDEVALFPYNYWEMQSTLFVVPSLEDMNCQFDTWAARFDPRTPWGINPQENSVL